MKTHLPKKTEYLHISSMKISIVTSTQCPPKNRDLTALLLMNGKGGKKALPDCFGKQDIHTLFLQANIW